MLPKDVFYLARTNGRLPHRIFGIRQADRFSHLYLIGKTGTGKSTLIQTLARQDIRAGHGIGLIDPHGDLAERLMQHIPEERRNDLIYLDAADPSQPYGYNPLRKVALDKIPLAASGLLESFKKLWEDAWGVRMEHMLRNTLYALLEYREATFPDILRMFTNTGFRESVVARVTNAQVRAFWEQEFPKYNPRYWQESIAPIQNKVGAFLADPRIYRMLTNPPIDLRLRKIMDDGKLLIVNLAKGRLGEDSANLFGALLVTSLSLAAWSRAEVSEEMRRPFFLYLDEFQSFTTLSVANMISELRKYRVGLVLAHQHLYQLEPDVRHAVIGNAGSIVSFRLGPEDAVIIGRIFEPVFSSNDLMNLPNHDIYLRLMVDGMPSKPFSATTLHPDLLEGF